MEGFEFRPQSLIDKAVGYSRHHRGITLPLIAIRMDAVSSQQRDEHLARPHIAHRKAILDGWGLLFPSSQALYNPLVCPLGGYFLPVGRRPGKQRLNTSEAFDKAIFIYELPGPSDGLNVVPDWVFE